MAYNKIHACPNDCILYRGAYEHSMACPRCDVSQYMQDIQGDKIPEKVLRHMPTLTRITHMFQCGSLARLMDWHSCNRSMECVWKASFLASFFWKLIPLHVLHVSRYITPWTSHGMLICTSIKDAIIRTCMNLVVSHFYWCKYSICLSSGF